MLTIGVEEEYLLIDSVTGMPVTRAARVRSAAGLQPALGDDEVQRELSQAQLEVATPVCRTLDEVGGHLLRLRHTLAQAAEDCGCRLAATGSAPFTDRLAVPITPTPRYRRMRRQAAAVADEQLINGMHVHVGVPDRDAGVTVLDALRPWLPLLIALSANSPLWQGRDTGFASWRTVVFDRWPVSGLPPHFAGAADYDRRTRRLLAAGLIDDTGQVYWQARLSERYPTIEVRAMDVQLRVDEAVLIAGLVRALAVHALDHPPVDEGDPPEFLGAAAWHAARHGTTGRLYDPLTGRIAPAREVTDGLLAHLEAPLRGSGDHRLAVRLLERLHGEGNGAVRQRRELRRRGRNGLIGMIRGETVGTR
ncbi:glutamate--cysteine ligase [Streptomyces sp. CB01881]|uniref:carboxylate-amine ligase n=1 Tax=Streptomyces sp. CB01881 TaxID=2078691 RepID=UPI000CDC4269|nr:glutamate--cysteine ligase [Streptomyces sp. CB01881]AUY53730.1 carboxylate--amine ligase [Streptomyces sp. CB01881]TYC68739.1 YbdK family carboxylate-amine ligase [Streptomyces sp. CB01881]